MTTLVIGVDGGATSTRAVVLDGRGQVRGRGRAGGANLNSSGGDLAATLAAAVRPALAAVDPGAVACSVVGLAGAGEAARARAQAAATRTWQDLGLGHLPEVVEDVLVAYAAGASAPDGLVLVAGTGAIAAAVSGWELADRCDGLGWLLGDDGSAVWLGMAAARAAVRAADGRGPATTLADRVGVALGAGPAPAAPEGGTGAPAARQAWEQAMVAAVFARPPAALGRLAPEVTAAAEAGDPVAASLVEQAADHLTATLTTPAPPAPPPVVVMAGALLTPDNPVGRGVHDRIAKRWPETIQRCAGPGELGAARLALTRLGLTDLAEPPGVSWSV